MGEVPEYPSLEPVPSGRGEPFYGSPPVGKLSVYLLFADDSRRWDLMLSVTISNTMPAWSDPDTRKTVELLLEQGPLLEAIEVGPETLDEIAEETERQKKVNQPETAAIQCTHEHAEVIDILRDEPTQKSELRKKTDYSEPAINNAISDLSKHDFLLSEDDKDIKLNVVGRLMFENYTQFCEQVAEITRRHG